MSAAHQLIRIRAFFFCGAFLPRIGGFLRSFRSSLTIDPPHHVCCLGTNCPSVESLCFLGCCNLSISSFHRSILAGSNFPPRRSGDFRYSSVNPRFSLRTVEYAVLSTRSRYSCTVVGSFVGFPVRPIVNLSLLLISHHTSFPENFARFSVPTPIWFCSGHSGHYKRPSGAGPVHC